MAGETLLVGLAHPDDELGAAGAILAQLARGDRVVIVWLTRGEMTEAFGPIASDEVARRRTEQGARAGEILGAETRFLDYPDTRLVHSRETAIDVAKLICEIRPTGLLTWGDAWVRGMRHPDHQAAGAIFRDAISLARIAKLMAPLTPHRLTVPIFTLRDIHSPLPAVTLDVSDHLEKIQELGRFYHQNVGFGNPEWLIDRLQTLGSRCSVPYGEEYDAWETEGGLVTSLLPPRPLANLMHPERDEVTPAR
jgi:LmbE family N-acetylglucosaminyl deacetylase